MAKKDKPTTPPTEAQKTYILDLKGGNTRRITVPAHWKLTFGNVVPYTERGNNHGVALRFYEGSKENLRAVFCDVCSFRDADMQIMEKRTSVKRKVAQKATKHGSKDVVMEARITEWVNPDNDDENSAEEADEFLQITDEKSGSDF